MAEGKAHDSDVLGTLMSLTVAFTLAMAFRGFVLEGFVIPTGSMGPTLMGAHLRVNDPMTGYEYAADATPAMAAARPDVLAAMFDPMLSHSLSIGVERASELAANARAGDRVLVLKPLFLFSEPRRWDVVVFKNPTDPVGDTQNYIKRLVGLPNETLLLFDGDVFTGPLGADAQQLKIERKPEHVQRAVWQPIYDSDYEPMVTTQQLESAMRRQWPGPPWIGAGPTAAEWKTAPQRAWSHPAGQAALHWNDAAWAVNDWNAYNMLRPPPALYAVSDLRLCAAVECADPANFATTFALSAGKQKCTFALKGSGTVAVKREVIESGETLNEASYTFQPNAEGLLWFEFWRVDQAMWVFVNGSLVGRLEYDFATLGDRLECSMFGRTVSDYVRSPTDARAPSPPSLDWTFSSAAPFSLHRVRVDRDLYYRPAFHDPQNQFAINGDEIKGPAFGTDWEHPAQLQKDEFLMLGDNSAASRDGRLWGRAHKLSLLTFGDAQPGVVPRDMIVGKAWCVYFPAPLPLTPGGATFIPDFGRLRFIR